jgi:hypothetical protein
MLRPWWVRVLAMRLTITSRLSKGRPRPLAVRWQNRRCSMGFHWLNPYRHVLGYAHTDPKLPLFGIQPQDRIAGVLESLPAISSNCRLRFGCWVSAMLLRWTGSEHFWCLSSWAAVLGHSACPHLPIDRSRVFPAPLLVTPGIAGGVGLHQFLPQGHHLVFLGRTAGSHFSITCHRNLARHRLSTPLGDRLHRDSGHA